MTLWCWFGVFGFSFKELQPHVACEGLAPVVQDNELLENLELPLTFLSLRLWLGFFRMGIMLFSSFRKYLTL